MDTNNDTFFNTMSDYFPKFNQIFPPQSDTGADQRDLDREQECIPELSRTYLPPEVKLEVIETLKCVQIG